MKIDKNTQIVLFQIGKKIVEIQNLHDSLPENVKSLIGFAGACGATDVRQDMELDEPTCESLAIFNTPILRAIHLLLEQNK
jgi:hypothetical protein